jgi:hypothetical protein
VPTPKKTITFEEFDPNNAEHISVWAVYAGGRFKTYASRGPALTGFANWTKEKLFEDVDGKWVLRALKNEAVKNDTCDHCGKQGVKESYTQDYYERYRWLQSAFCWQRVNGPRSKISDPLTLMFLCLHCKRQLGL